MSRRVMRELALLRTELPFYIHAVPREDNMFKVDVIFAYLPHDDKKPRAAPYAHGLYWFVLTIPETYPHGGFKMFARTPTARFETESNLCTDETSFHAREANKALSITAFLVSFADFMTREDMGGIGYVRNATDEQRWDAALNSMHWNLKHPEFRRAFPDLTDDMQVNQLILNPPAPSPPPTEPVKRDQPDPTVIFDDSDDEIESSDPIPVPRRKKARRTLSDDVEIVEQPLEMPLELRVDVHSDAEIPDLLTGSNTRAVTWTVEAPNRPHLDRMARVQLSPDFVAIVNEFANVPKTVQGLCEWALRVGRQPNALQNATDNIYKHMQAAIIEYNLPPQAPPPLPNDALGKLAIPLRPHQEQIFALLLDLDHRGGGFLGDAPGLGKTVDLAAVAKVNGGKTLIVVMSKLKTQWHNEMLRMGVPESQFHIITRNVYFEENKYRRILVDEAHQSKQISQGLRNRLHNARVGGCAIWLVSGTPNYDCMRFLQTTLGGADTFLHWHRRAIVRARADVALNLPPMHEWTVAVDLTPEHRALYAQIAATMRAAIDRDEEFGHRSWHRFKLVLRKLMRALATGQYVDVLREVQLYAVRPDDEPQRARALRLNRPGETAHVEDWLKFASRSGTECPICLGTLEMETTVYFSACRHTTCMACFDACMKDRGAPHCGLPCKPTSYGACYLMSMLHQIADERAKKKDEAHEIEEETIQNALKRVEKTAKTAPAVIGSAKIDRLKLIVRAALREKQRVAVASHDMELLHELGKILPGQPAKLTQGTTGSAMGPILERIVAGQVPVLLIHTQCANAGLNLQHYDHVVLMDESLDPTEERQLLARFCRMGATVPRVLVHHLVTANTIEQRLAERRSADAPLPREVVNMLQ